jgi:chemotaxis signal transduction protein
MAIYSPLRSRRFARHQVAETEQLITFRLRQEWFAVKIEEVVKVVPLGEIYGDPHHQGLGLTLYQGQELLVVDIGFRLFQEAPISDSNSNPDWQKAKFLLILNSANQTQVGLPIDSPPTLVRVAPSNFKPLPEDYLTYGNIKCVSSLIVELEDKPPLFLLDPVALLEFRI